MILNWISPEKWSVKIMIRNFSYIDPKSSKIAIIKHFLTKCIYFCFIYYHSLKSSFGSCYYLLNVLFKQISLIININCLASSKNSNFNNNYVPFFPLPLVTIIYLFLLAHWLILLLDSASWRSHWKE